MSVDKGTPLLGLVLQGPPEKEFPFWRLSKAGKLENYYSLAASAGGPTAERMPIFEPWDPESSKTECPSLGVPLWGRFYSLTL